MKILMSIVVSVLMFIQPALAEEHHHHESSENTKLTLDSGKKWETDAPLRGGMLGIKTALEAKISDIHEKKATKAQYLELSNAIMKNVNSIFENCKLTAQADAQLHIVLAQIMDGASTMKNASKVSEMRKGAVKVIQALDQYSEHFNHPNWTPLKHD